MLDKWFWLNTVMEQQKQEHYMNVQTDPLDNPLTTWPLWTGWEQSIEPYPNCKFGWIHDIGYIFGDGSIPTQIWTHNGGPEPFLSLLLPITFLAIHCSPSSLFVSFPCFFSDILSSSLYEPISCSVNTIKISTNHFPFLYLPIHLYSSDSLILEYSSYYFSHCYILFLVAFLL